MFRLFMIFPFIIVITSAIFTSWYAYSQNRKRENNIDPNNPPPQKAIWWRRFIGLIIDVILIGLLIGIISILTNTDKYLTYYFLVFYSFYYIIFESIYSRTLGKYVTNTIVVNNKTYGKPRTGQIIARTIARIFPFEAFSYLAKRPSGWHDEISNTMVIFKENRIDFQSNLDDKV